MFTTFINFFFNFLDLLYLSYKVDFAKEVFPNLVQSDGYYSGNQDRVDEPDFDNKEEYFKYQKEGLKESKFSKSEPKVPFFFLSTLSH